MLDDSFEFWILNQFSDDFFNGSIDSLLIPLPLIAALMPSDRGPMLAMVVVILFIVGAVLLLFTVDITVHTGSANRTAYYSRQNVFVIEIMNFFCFISCRFTLLLSQFPILYRNDRFMYSFVYGIIVLFNYMELITGTGNLLGFSPTEGYLSAINRIIQYKGNEMSRKHIQRIVLALLLFVAVFVEIGCYRNDAHIGMYIFIINKPNNVNFIFCNQKFAFFKFITVWSKTAVPFALTGFLSTPFHRLYKNVLSLDFGNSG